MGAIRAKAPGYKAQVDREAASITPLMATTSGSESSWANISAREFIDEDDRGTPVKRRFEVPVGERPACVSLSTAVLSPAHSQFSQVVARMTFALCSLHVIVLLVSIFYL